MPEIKILVKLSKNGLMRYISHLDFVRLIYRVLRRADVPFILTQGFNPHPKVKFGQALKLGNTGEMENVFFFSKEMDLKEFKERLSKLLPEGIKVLELNYDK